MDAESTREGRRQPDAIGDDALFHFENALPAARSHMEDLLDEDEIKHPKCDLGLLGLAPIRGKPGYFSVRATSEIVRLVKVGQE